MQRKAGRLVLVAIILLAAAMPVMGQTLDTAGGNTRHWHLAPAALPFTGAALPGIPVASLKLNEDDGLTDGTDAYIGQIVISVGGSSPHPVDLDNITAVHLYRGKGNGEKDWVFGTYPTDLDAISTGVTTTLNDTTQEITLNIDNATAVVNEDSSDTTFYVTIDYDQDVVKGSNVIYSFESVSYGASQGSVTKTLDSTSTPALRPLDNPTNGWVTSTDIYDYLVEFGGADLVGGPIDQEQGAEDLPIMRIDLGGGATEAAKKDLEQITFEYTGDSIDDVLPASVRLYFDADDSGDFDKAQDELVATGTGWSGTEITLTIDDSILFNDTSAVQTETQDLNNIFASEESFFLVINIADLGAVQLGRDISFRVNDPSQTANVSFYDSIDDAIEGTTAGVGPTGGEYDQIGYINSTTPLSSTVINIIEKTAEDTTAPVINASTPSDTDTGVSRNLASVRLTFSDEMVEGGGATAVDNLSNYSMTGPTSVTLSGVSYSSTNQTATLTIDAGSLPLQYGGTYTVSVSSLANSDGYAMPAAQTITFTIEEETIPTVFATVPANNATGTAIDTVVSVVFSEPMDEESVTDGANFSLVASGATEGVAGTLAYNADANTVTFTPDEALAYDTEYTATVAAGVLDAEGSALEEGYAFSFTTVAQVGEFENAIVANNRIQPGSSEPMRIYLEVPAGANATDAVAIQVYTATGRRVATLTAAGDTYASVIARQPILWYGTNGRGQDLGPGLYFIQVRSAGFEQSFRALIVR
jgi:hypothetical protein